MGLTGMNDGMEYFRVCIHPPTDETSGHTDAEEQTGINSFPPSHFNLMTKVFVALPPQLQSSGNTGGQSRPEITGTTWPSSQRSLCPFSCRAVGKCSARIGWNPLERYTKIYARL